MKVVIVGFGIMGCSAAVALLERIPGIELTVVAKDFSPNLTTDIAAGFWEPYCFQNTPAESINKWSGATYKYIESMIFTPLGGELGAYYFHANRLHLEHCEDPVYHKIPHSYRRLNRDELRHYGSQYVDGIAFKSVMLEGSRYIKYFTARLKSKGVRFVTKTIQSFDELVDYDLIVNCSGLGAHYLCNDKLVQPVRGQLIKVHAPFVKEGILVSSEIHDVVMYVFPRIADTVIGGTTQKGNWSLEPDPEDRERIYRQAIKLMPALKGAKVIGDFVGLRPGRDAVRLEVEFYRSTSGKPLPIVHNYGHGGSGLTTFWGCALDVVKLVKDNIDTTAKL